MRALLRLVLPAALALLLLSCGGGGGGGGGGSGGNSLAGVGGATVSSADSGSGVSAGSASTGVAAADGAGASSGGVAAGSPDGSVASASAGGGDDAGVGSGGTGVSTASAVGIGGVDGFGSVILNDVRFDIDHALVDVQDAPALQIGMSARIAGSLSPDFASGTAQQLVSAAELRGVVTAVDLSSGTLAVAGTSVATDTGTVWGNVSGLFALAPGARVQVWGLPGAPGTLLATRIELTSTPGAIVTGTIQGLDPLNRSFVLGGLTVGYAAASTASQVTATLANGSIVRVRSADDPAGGAVGASSVQDWYALPVAASGPVSLAGVVTDYASLGSFRLLGAPVDASVAQITGGPSSAIGNGVHVVIDGTLVNGVVVASRLKIRKVPGTGGPSSFLVVGTLGDFRSPASFKVRGQPVDASGPSVQFVNGGIGNLGNGTKVTVSGSQVVNGVLLADRIEFN